MKRSAELESLCRRFYQARASGNSKTTGSFFSHQHGVLAIGSDPSEWWEEHDAVEHAVKRQARQIGKVEIHVDQLAALEEGTVGWAAGRLAMKFQSGHLFSIRSTMVFHKERGVWKIVQYHASLATPNSDATGKR